MQTPAYRSKLIAVRISDEKIFPKLSKTACNLHRTLPNIHTPRIWIREKNEGEIKDHFYLIDDSEGKGETNSEINTR